MTYRSGLGATNIGVDNTAAIRAFQAQTRVPMSTPPVLIRPVPTFTPTAPRPATTPTKPTTPILKVGVPTTPKAPLPPPVFKATVAPTATKSPTVSMKPVGGASLVTERTDTLLGKLTSSPLPLIAFGLGALFLFNRKKGR